MTEVLEKQSEKNFVQMTLRLPVELHILATKRMSSMGFKFQGLVTHLLTRWIEGEFDRRVDRPLTPQEKKEDAELLRAIHHPATRDEEMLSQNAKFWLQLKKKGAARKADETHHQR